MHGDAFQNWRREREAIEREMDHLITGGVPTSIEERQVRRTRFAALIERRETAARELLHRSRASSRDKSPTGSSRPGDRLIPAAHAGAGAEGDQAKFVPLPDEKGKVETAHVTTDASPSDVVALDAAALTPGSAAVLAAGLPADAVELPSDVVALPPRVALDSDAVSAASLPSEVAGSFPDVVARAADATSRTLDSAAVPADGFPADAAEPSTDVPHAPEAAALPPDSAAVPTAAPPADAPEPSGDVVAHASNAAVPLDSAAVPTTGPPADVAQPSADVVAHAPDTVLPTDVVAVPAEGTEVSAGVGLLAHYVAVPAASYSPNTVANPADAVPSAGDAKTDDLHSDPSLLKLLRRLQSKLSRARHETVTDGK